LKLKILATNLQQEREIGEKII